MKVRFLVPAAIFLVLFGFFVVALHRSGQNDYDPTLIVSPLLGKPAPNFDLPSVEDPARNVSSATFANQFHLVNVWATWCVACREEHSMLLELARQQVVPIVGIDWNDDRARAQRWLQDLGNPYTAIAFDNEGRAAIDWGVSAAPETFLVDDKGIVRCKQVGIMNPADWERKFLPIIRGKRQGTC